MDSSPVSAGTTPPQTLAVPAPSSLEVLWALQASPRCQHKPGLVLTTRWPVANGVLSWDWTNPKLGLTMTRKPYTYIYICIYNVQYLNIISSAKTQHKSRFQGKPSCFSSHLNAWKAESYGLIGWFTTAPPKNSWKGHDFGWWQPRKSGE